MKHFAGIVLVVSAVSLALGLISPRCAFGTGFLTVSPAMRSQGMGSVGAADDSDPANAFFNPAAIISSGRTFFTFGYNSFPHAYYGAESKMYTYNAGAGAGTEMPLGDGWKCRIGGGLRYSSYASEFNSGSIYLPDMRRFHDNESYVSLTLGVGCARGDVFYGGVGLAVKPWREEYGYDPGGVTYSKTAYDLGFIARMHIIKTERMTLSSSYGLSFLNLGGIIYGNHALPKTYRYGFGLRLEGANSDYFREHFGVEVPIFAASADFDFIDDRTQNGSGHGNTWGLGTEMGLYQTLFLRGGFNHVYENMTYSSVGLGLGFTSKKYWARFDFAAVGQVYDGGFTDKYGLSLGLNY